MARLHPFSQRKASEAIKQVELNAPSVTDLDLILLSLGTELQLDMRPCGDGAL